MDMDEVQTFIVLADCRNFTTAAEILHVVQSTVSNRIRSLEKYTGTQLVLRYKNGIQLTEEGAAFLTYANQISALNQRALQEIHMHKKFRATLRIGCVQWMYDRWLGKLLVHFAKRFPDISLHIEIEHSENMIAMLQNKLLDLAFIAYEINNGSVASQLFKSTDILFVGIPEVFGGFKEGICKQELVQIPLIYSDIWDHYLEDISKHMLSGGMVFCVHSNMLASAKQFCLAGIGCCFLPEAMLEQELNEEKLIRIPIYDLPIRRMNVYIACQQGNKQSQAFRDWILSFQETGENGPAL